MQPTSGLEAVRPLLDLMARTLWPLFQRAVTPIAAIRGEQTVPFGTGTFFRVADESFLVTAAHVWEEAERLGFGQELFAFDPVESAGGLFTMNAVPLAGTWHYAKDPADVAIMELDRPVVELLRGAHFLRLNEVALRPRPGGRCWVFGFPAETARDLAADRLFRFDPFCLMAPQHPGDAALDGYDPAGHFLLDAARDDMWRPDGTRSDMPYRLNGISGCSVWQPEWPPGNDAARWDPARTRIVGVQTSYYRKKSLIKATGWGAVASVLHQRRADLRPAIEFHLGRP